MAFNFDLTKLDTTAQTVQKIVTPNVTKTPIATVPVAKAAAQTKTAASVSHPFKALENTQKTDVKPNTVFDKKLGAKTAEKTQDKDGESVSERMSRYYTKYSTSTRKEKDAYFEKYITKHYETLKDKPRNEQVKIQLADFKKLLKNTKNPDDYQMISRKINVLQKENQVSAAKNATIEQSNKILKARGEIGVAETIHNCHADNQKALTSLVVKSKNEQAIKIGASHASECNTKNQVEIVKIYQKIDNVKVSKIIVDQYAKFAKENQVAIHKTISTSKHEETLKYAASNIWHFDKSNQAAAVKITAATGNEAAIKAAAEQYAKYDKSAREEIKTTISETKCDSAKETLAQAEKEVKAQETQGKEPKDTENKSTATEIKTDSQLPKSLTESVKAMVDSNSPESALKLQDTIKNASNAEKINLLSNLSPVDLVKVVDIMVQSNASSEVLSKALSLLEGVDSKAQKELIQRINNSSMANVISPKIYLLGQNAQSIFVKQSIKEGLLSSISREKLSTNVKKEYDSLIKDEKRNIG